MICKMDEAYRLCPRAKKYSDKSEEVQFPCLVRQFDAYIERMKKTYSKYCLNQSLISFFGQGRFNNSLSFYLLFTNLP